MRFGLDRIDGLLELVNVLIPTKELGPAEAIRSKRLRVVPKSTAPKRCARVLQ